MFNSNKSKFYIDLEYLVSTSQFRKILPYYSLAILCVLQISLGTECFPKFLAPVVFSREKIVCPWVYCQCIFCFAFLSVTPWFFLAPLLVWVVIPQRNFWMYTNTRTHILLYLFSSCSQKALRHHFSDSNACCWFALLLSLWFKELAFCWTQWG